MNMQKYLLTAISLFLMALIPLQCLIKSNRQIVKVEDGGKELTQVLHFGQSVVSLAVYVRENTLNDTARCENGIIPPGFKGRLISADWYADTILFHYRPYKATSGKLILQYVSQNL
jgi:hypothetical protein